MAEELNQERRDSHDERHQLEHQIRDERWTAHQREHESMAHNLSEYKAQANEWRQSLIDLRSTFVSKGELEGLVAKSEGTHDSLDSKIEALDKRLDTEREERRDQQNLRTGLSRGISTGTAIVVGAIGLVGTILGVVVVISNILSSTP